MQTSFADLTKDDLAVFFHHAWNEYKISGRTHLLESFTSGFIFAQLSAKQGIKKYGKEAEIQLLAEFKQLMEYKMFHGRKASDLTYEQKKRAANMINLIEEKVNRGHTDEAYSTNEYSEACTQRKRRLHQQYLKMRFS